MKPMQDKIQDMERYRNALENLCSGTYSVFASRQPDDDDIVLSRALDELERLRKSQNVTDANWRELMEENERLKHSAETFLEEIERLRAQNVEALAMAGKGFERLLETIRFYSDERAYQSSWYWKAESYTQKARDTLKAIGINK
jgi:hypothetical protein